MRKIVFNHEIKSVKTEVFIILIIKKNKHIKCAYPCQDQRTLTRQNLILFSGHLFLSLRLCYNKKTWQIFFKLLGTSKRV